MKMSREASGCPRGVKGRGVTLRRASWCDVIEASGHEGAPAEVLTATAAQARPRRLLGRSHVETRVTQRKHQATL